MAGLLLMVVVTIAAAAASSHPPAAVSASAAMVANMEQCSDNGTYYRAHWCGKPPPENLTFLDDRGCAKRFPTSCSRLWRCPLEGSHPPAAAGWAPASPLKSVQVDTRVLASVPELSSVRFAAVIIRRSASGVFYRYFGGPNYEQPFETWSSSKIFAMANAATAVDRRCPAIGGLSADTHGKLGLTPLGDLATIICSYDRTMNYTSNSLARYFHDLGGRKRANWLIQEWLGAGKNQSFGGNYGEPTPRDLSFTLTRGDATEKPGAAQDTCTVPPDHSGIIIPNSLSVLTMVELVKLIVMHRDLPPALALPRVTWEDLQQELYGHGGEDGLFPSVQWGGMASDTAIFMQAAVEASLGNAALSGDQWRIFSKLGAGYSTSRHVGEIVHNSYGCFPSVGVEMIYSARSSVPGDTQLYAAERALNAGITAGVKALVQATSGDDAE
jgi:hypothetical protein